MSIRIKLIGCTRYTYGPKGETFEKGYEYELDDEKARTLLASNNDKGLPFFTRVERPAPAMEETVIEETTGGEVGGVRIIRKKAAPRPNPKVKTSGDLSPLRNDGKDEAAGEDADADEGAVEV